VTPSRHPLSILCLLGLASCGTAAGAPAHGQEGRFEEQIEVRRLIFDVRALAREGGPLLGLGEGDFRVRIAGQEARVEAVDWLGAGATVPEEPLVEQAETDREDLEAVGDDRLLAETAPPLVVLFFQRDLYPGRIPGILRMLIEARRWVEGLEGHQKVAIVSYTPRLYLHLDFTDDREEILAALDTVLPFREPEPMVPSGALSLVRNLDPSAARSAPSADRALELVAKALEPLPGPKSLLYFGWGLGELASGVVRPKPGFAEARESLRQGRVAFFALDVTWADYHSLEALLRSLSYDTGGLYMSTFHLPRLAMQATAAAVTGHYRLTVVAPDLPPGHHHISIRLVGHRGRVFHPVQARILPSG
jgi:hypothetical protein